MGELTRNTLAVHAERLLARHGRSFHWASRWLGREDAVRVALLYAFCRRVDDLVDDKPAAEAREALRAVRSELARAESADPTIQAYLALSGERPIPGDVVAHFLEGFATDLGPVRIADEGELLRYCYGAAGTVGLMMCHVLGVTEAEAHPFAVDLGVAMQLTNIARDVLEDAARDRVYLPATWLADRVTPDALLGGDPDARAEAYLAARRVLDLAQRFYRSADRGMGYLPRRARFAILIAARVYEAIGTVIRRDPGAYWEARAYVGRFHKLRRTARAVAALLLDPHYWRRGMPRLHEARLHRALRGLPGADLAA